MMLCNKELSLPVGRFLPKVVQGILLITLVFLTACGGSSGGNSDNTVTPPVVAPPTTPPTPPITPPVAPTPLPSAGVDWNRDILSTDLSINVATRNATAVIELAGSDSQAASLEIGDLRIDDVKADVDGEVRSLEYVTEEGALHMGVPPSASPTAVTIDYAYNNHEDFDGAMSNGLTFTWPYFCGNLFPCKSDPVEGLQFQLSMNGLPMQQQAIFPADISADAPSYMLGWAIGDYAYLDLGVTSAGTQVGAWYLEGEMSATLTGTATLRAIFEWLETNYGAYTFGLDVASVSAPWGEGAFGGMEHHPFWHIASASMGDAEAHAHEAAHGWFGNGIRIACWEDFVLSEGVATYLAARGVEQTAGTAASNNVWNSYETRLERLQNGDTNKIAWPQSCAMVDVLEDGLFSDAAYVKGAFFLRSLEERIGREMLDDILALFYTRHVGQAARMEDLLNLVSTQSGYDPTECANAWLQNESVPAVRACL